MATKKKLSRITVTHPVTNREMKMDALIYEPVKTAILHSLRNGRSRTFAELTEDVVQIIRKKLPSFKGSVPWYTISIRLDLESKGIVETYTEKGKKLNRLRK